MGKKATILIIDKEKILVDLLIRSLTSPELSVMGATSAEEGTRLIELHGPDLLVIDPAISNAFALMASVREGSLPAKIVAVTASDEIRERVRAMGIETIVDRHSGLDALVGAIRSSLPTDLSILAEDNRVGVLIVDDEDELRIVVSEFLKGRGYAASGAKKGPDALDRIHDDPSIQIVLLDVMMPIMGGMEVLRKIMAMDRHPNVIMMTAVADREIARQAMKIGAFDYILKPFDFAAIEASVTACLSHSEYQKQPWWKRLTRG
jgi:DNA-binding NtrC family response regulator